MAPFYSFFAELQLLLILSFGYFLQAQIQYHATTQVPARWTNNNLSLPSPFSSVRIILLNEKPNAKTTRSQGTSVVESIASFACGFYSYYGENNPTYFAIALAKISKSENSGQEILSFGRLIWVANRNKPVGNNATLELLQDGDLVLKDADGILIWSTGTSNMSVAGMKMMETGNLVLYNNENKVVWESFDYPTDALLPGQKLKAGRKLVASVSGNNWSEGSFYLSVTSHGLFAFYNADVPQLYFNFSAPAMVESIELNYNTSSSISLSWSSDPNPVFTSPLDDANMSYMKFAPDGHLMIYDDNKYESFDALSDVLDTCDYPTACGNYGLCSYAGCSCPKGFALDNVTDARGRTGCLEINSTTCLNLQSQYLLPYENVYHFTYSDPDAAVLKGTDIENCKEACLKNCSCKVALFQYLNLSYGNCFFPSPVLTLIHGRTRRYYYQSLAFIKVSKERGSKRGGSSSIHSEIIAGSVIGTFFLVGLIAGLFWFLGFRKKEDDEESLEDFLDQLSEMPRRFTYMELKIATHDFQKKLGEGGFGSVFEGNLENGEQVAVKRLEFFGQGKKEFLAEVKTIGGIHHLNLVRLIGFCAEKLHRLLVYEHMCNGSLENWIFHEKPLQPSLDWKARRTIILDIAKGLAYLHGDCKQKIVHLDIKPQNILLDANFRAKISDFGLCKLIEKDQSQVATTIRGTPGYLAPEWFLSVITEKVDVYSFGIVVMETICGRKILDSSLPEECVHLLPILMKKVEEDRLIDMVDKSCQDMWLHRSEAVELMRVAIWCLQSDFTRRPSMEMVVKVLEGTMDVETNVDCSIQSPTTLAASRGQAELDTSTIPEPEVLSGPR